MKLIIGSSIAFSLFLTMVTGDRGREEGITNEDVNIFPENTSLGPAILILEPTPSQFNESQSIEVMNVVNSFIIASLVDIDNTVALESFEMADFNRCVARNLRRRHLIDAEHVNHDGNARFSTHIKVNNVIVSSGDESIPANALRETLKNVFIGIPSEPSVSLLETLGGHGYGFITQADLLWSGVDHIPSCIPSLPPTNIFSNVPSLFPTHISSNIPSLTPSHVPDVPDTTSLPPASNPPSPLPTVINIPINGIQTISTPENKDRFKYIVTFTTVGFVALAGIAGFLWRHSRKAGSDTVSNTPDNMNGSKIKELKGLADSYDSDHESDSDRSHIANMLLAAKKGTKILNETPIYRKEFINSWRNVDQRQTPDVVPLTSNVSNSTSSSTTLSRNVSISESTISRTSENFEQDSFWDPDDNDTGSCDKTDDETQNSDNISHLIYLSDVRQQERTHSFGMI